MNIQIEEVEINLEFMQDDEFSIPYYMICDDQGFYLGRIKYIDGKWESGLYSSYLHDSNFFFAVAIALEELNYELEERRNNFWYQLAEFFNDCVDWIKSKFQ